MTADIVPWRWKKRRVPVGEESDLITNLQRQVNRLFSEVVSGASRLPDFVSEPLTHVGERLTAFSPNIDVRKGNGAVIISAELPGMDEKDVEISLTSDGLTIRGERKPPLQSSGQQEWNYAESVYGLFERVVPLTGLSVREDGIEATAHKGIVTITVPLREATSSMDKVTQIQVSDGRSG
jgi:HSP20 family protein